MAETKRRRRKKAAASSRGLEAGRLAAGDQPKEIAALAAKVTGDGGVVIGAYRDPLGGHWQIFAGLPLEKVEPTPYQRDLSESHVKRLTDAIDRLDRYLDPVIAVRTDGGQYWTPNGHHRIAALRALGARSVVALVVPEAEVARRILLLNTEKAHNLRERAIEVIRLAQGLAELDDRPEKDFEAEFEEPTLLTLGLCYQANGRFAGATYHSVLKRIDQFSGSKLGKALEGRKAKAQKLLELNEAVDVAVKQLKERGFQSPYLKAFVVARINPLRFKRGVRAEFDDTIDHMISAAKKFDAAKVKSDQVAQAGGPAED